MLEGVGTAITSAKIGSPVRPAADHLLFSSADSAQKDQKITNAACHLNYPQKKVNIRRSLSLGWR